MLVADTYLGNVEEEHVAWRVEDSDPLRIDVTKTERRRSRFRTTAESGHEVGVVVDRDLRGGDVLGADGTLVIVRLEPVEAMILDFTRADVAPTRALEIGHVIGNRHWTLAVRGDEVLLPVADERVRMEAAVRPLEADGVEVGYTEVSPALFDGGSGPADHVHRHAHAHGIGHEHSRTEDGPPRPRDLRGLDDLPARSADE